MQIIGTALALAAPAPISLIGIRQGAYKAFLAVVFAATIIFLPFGNVGSASFVLGAGFLGIAFGIAVKKTNSSGEAILVLTIAALASKLVFMWFMIYTQEYNPFALDENSLNALMNSLNTSGAGDDILTALAQQISLLTPSFLIMGASLDVFMNYFIISKVEDRRQKLISASPSSTDNELKVFALPPFEQWTFPRSLLTAFITAFLITLFDNSGSSRILLSAELNLKILTSLMFFIQGAGFIWWGVLYKNFSYGIRLSIFLVILLFIPIFFMGIIIIGIVDIAVDLRGKIRRSNK